MTSMPSKTLGTRLSAATVGLLLVLFGGYLAYAKVIGSFQSGFVDERIGPVMRAVEPGWFWYAIVFYTVVSLGIVVAGAALVRFALRR